jgi:hypothetical protein
MEKILLAVDAIHPDRNSLDFSCYLGRLTKSAITGVFLENLAIGQRLELQNNYSSEYAAVRSWDPSQEYIAQLEFIEKNIFLFKEGCSNREVCYKVHRDRGVPTQELIEETRFADLLVVDPTTSFSKRFESPPTSFIRNLLKKSECPVIIAPESFEAIDEIVFSYNLSASSMFAIKHFTYLFPQLHDKKIRVLQINREGEWLGTEKYKLKEWLKCYYANFFFEAIKGDMEIELFDYLLKRKNALLVMGAVGRNAVSRFFSRNPAESLIQTVSQPIFIAHG